MVVSRETIVLLEHSNRHLKFLTSSLSVVRSLADIIGASPYRLLHAKEKGYPPRRTFMIILRHISHHYYTTTTATITITWPPSFMDHTN